MGLNLGQIGAGLLNPTALLGTGLAMGGDIFNYYGAQKDRQAQMEMNERNYAMQKEFAQMGIRWKVDDAKAAGLHPLAALGASTVGASPSFQMGNSGETSSHYAGRAMNRMGQDISRAMMASQTQTERTKDLLTELKLERAGMQNDILRSQLARLNSGQVGPGVPMPDTQIYTTSDGTSYQGPSPEWSQAHQGLMGSTAGWYLRNNILPFIKNAPKTFSKWALDEYKYERGQYDRLRRK